MKPRRNWRLLLKPGMPPTRGHDLKLTAAKTLTLEVDAPHTGARLETFIMAICPARNAMPPTRGHDLKQLLPVIGVILGGCPPHGGTT